MPLRPELKEAIEKSEGMTDAYRKQLLKTMESAPDELQAGWLRQADYDRTMNEGKEDLKKQGDDLRAKEEVLETKTQEWNKWKGDADKIVADNVTRANTMEKELVTRDEKIVELQDKIRMGDFSEGSESEMLREVTTLRDEIKDLRTASANGGGFTKDDAEKMLLEGGNRLAGNIYDNIFLLMDLNQSHNAEFKESLDREKFIEFATERGMVGTQKEFKTAYDLYVQDKRVEVKITEARLDERTKIESKRTFPLDNDGGEQSLGKGPVETRLEQLNSEAEGASHLTTKQAAAAAAAELRKEGKVAPE